MAEENASLKSRGYDILVADREGLRDVEAEVSHDLHPVVQLGICEGF